MLSESLFCWHRLQKHLNYFDNSTIIITKEHSTAPVSCDLHVCDPDKPHNGGLSEHRHVVTLIDINAMQIVTKR